MPLGQSILEGGKPRCWEWELVDEGYNIEYAILRLEELLAPNSDEHESSNDFMIDNPPEDDSSDE